MLFQNNIPHMRVTNNNKINGTVMSKIPF